MDLCPHTHQKSLRGEGYQHQKERERKSQMKRVVGGGVFDIQTKEKRDRKRLHLS